MAAGTQAYIVGQEYDPRKITLEEFISMFEKESTEQGGRKNQTWGNLIRNNPVTKKYLDQPAIMLFGAVPSDSDSIMADIQNAAKGQASTIQSKFRVIEANLFPKLATLGKKEGVDLLSGYSEISKEVKKLQTRGGKFTAKKGFNVNKVGELIENLIEHVKNNPKDKPIANAIMFNLENGSRPSLTTELRTFMYEKNRFEEAAQTMGLTGRDGLLIPAGTTGVKRQAKDQSPNIQPYNAPLSKRAIAILQDQSEYNKNIIGDNRKLDFYFQIEEPKGTKFYKKGEMRPISLEDINKVLKKTTPKGLLIEYTTKGSKELSEPITSKNLRNLFLNIGALSITNKTNLAMLTNRDMAENTGSQEIYMGKPGQYNQGAIDDLDKISLRTWGLFSLRNPEAQKIYKEQGKFRNINEFIFGKNELDATGKLIPEEITYENFNTVKAKPIPIQTTGFAPPEETTTTEKTFVAKEENKKVLDFDDFDDDEKNEMRKLGIYDKDAGSNEPTRIQKAKGLKSIDPFAIGVGGAGVSEILDETGELVGEEITQSTIAQTLAKTAPKLAQTALGKALPVAGAGIIFPTSPTNVDEIEGFARKDIDTRFGGIDQMDTSQEKQIFRDDPRLRKTSGMYDPSELPRRDADDPLSDEAYRKRFLEQSRRKAGSQLRGFAQPR